MDKLNILVTGGGAPGIEGTLFSLSNHNVITCDIDNNAVGRYLSGKFYKIYPPSDKYYLTKLKWICKNEDIDVILPQCTAELDILSFADLPVQIAVAGRNIGKDEVSTGKIVHNIDEIVEYATIYNKFVIKPLNMNGSRGVKVISTEKTDFFSKPGIPHMDLIELDRRLPEEFELFVMPFYDGEEITVDCFQGEEFTAIPRKRNKIRSGITFEAELIEDLDLIDKSRVLAERLGLRYAFGFQFIDGNVIECNPRVQGTMVASTLAGANMIEAACLHAVGLPYKFDIDWSTKFYRYWGGITNKKVKI